MVFYVELPCRVVQNAILGYAAQPSPYAELPPTAKTLCNVSYIASFHDSKLHCEFSTILQTALRLVLVTLQLWGICAYVELPPWAYLLPTIGVVGLLTELFTILFTWLTQVNTNLFLSHIFNCKVISTTFSVVSSMGLITVLNSLCCSFQKKENISFTVLFRQIDNKQYNADALYVVYAIRQKPLSFVSTVLYCTVLHVHQCTKFMAKMCFPSFRPH